MTARWRLIIFSCLLLFLEASTGCSVLAGQFLGRFFPPGPPSVPAPVLSLPPLQTIEKREISVGQKNQAVRKNNEGVDAMSAKDYRRAASCFEDAVKLNPGETSIRKNLLTALQQDGSSPQKVIEVSMKLMSMDPTDQIPPYAAGLALMEKLKQPRDALPFFEEACRRKPQNARIWVALGSCWDKAGYPDQALSILREKAPLISDDPYPMFELGILLLGRKDYAAAVRALRSAQALDKEGYVHNALIRARFYGGDLDGLAQEAAGTLHKFPGIINRKSLERILFALGPHEFDFTEEVQVQVANPDSVRSFRFLMRLLPAVPNHQAVELRGASIESQGRVVSVTGTGPDADGRYAFVCSEKIGARLILRLQYRVVVQAWLGSRGPFITQGSPDMARLMGDETFSLNDNRLDAVYRSLTRMPGNFLQNAYLAVGRGLSYRENFEDNTVSWALQNLDACDCTEFARVLAALCLKRGLAARVVTGFLVKDEFLRKSTSIGHAWCEVYFRERGWIPVDPTLGVNMDWAYFGNLLSDQIVFDPLENRKKTRIGVDFVSESSDARLKIENFYHVRLVK